MMGDLSVADVLAASNTSKNDGFLEGNGIIILILFFLIFGFGGGAFGGGGNSNAVTQAELQNGFNTNNILAKLDSIGNGICSSAYENAQLINGVNQNISNGFLGMQASINNLGYQMQQCCCDIKTQMLSDKYEAVQSQLSQAQGVIANTAQTQYILDQLGRYYTYPALNPCCAYGCGA